MISKRKVRGVIRINAFEVISRAVEEGVERGWRRAHKHTNEPEEAAILAAIDEAVMNAICEVVKFED